MAIYPIKTYSELVTHLVRRRHDLGMSQIDMDARTGLADGYVAKIECGTKRLGPTSLPCILGALGVSILIVPDSQLPSWTPLPRRRVTMAGQLRLDLDEVAA